MKTKLTLATCFMLLVSMASLHAQEQIKLYYDQNGKGLDEKKKAFYYRIVSFDAEDRPVGIVEDYFKSGKIQGKGEAIYIDKLDDSKSLWKNNQKIYNEKGVLLRDNNYDQEGKPHGILTAYDDKGIKRTEEEYNHGNPSKDHYVVYDKGEAIKYSYLTRLPMKLATSGKKIVPITERKTMYEDGVPIQYYFFDGISVAVKFTSENAYGNYYAAYITIENGTDKEFNLDPKDFSAVLSNKGQVEEVQILTYDYYIKKVNRRQAWSAAFNAFAQTQAANQAGYSASSSTAVAVNNSGGAAIGASATQSYNGSAQYAANQNATNNINQYGNQQYNIRKSITQGYLKINTVFPSTRIIGYVNIKYQKADGLILNIPINGKVYQFGV
ncbi:hypothetical protein [Pedobacter sp. JCM 36344]|uniref:hypothetical protein n=1 Tax=Pedobacter sp. JCM 36344 TaxID=3374280 RepID=UPI00397B157F